MTQHNKYVCDKRITPIHASIIYVYVHYIREYK